MDIIWDIQQQREHGKDAEGEECRNATEHVCLGTTFSCKAAGPVLHLGVAGTLHCLPVP